MEDFRMDLKGLVEEERMNRYRRLSLDREAYEKVLVKKYSESTGRVFRFKLDTLSDSDIDVFISLAKEHARQNGYGILMTEVIAWGVVRFTIKKDGVFCNTLSIKTSLGCLTTLLLTGCCMLGIIFRLFR
ncbi:MAG: hypothetical protein ACRDDH_11845 [Cetobacterium sp.]|uniref:hypothetical protein n=1 Tax=Cetobacterium sp. TaxID=2071632 RepID=UPI003EE73075